MPWYEVKDTGDSQSDGTVYTPERVFIVSGVPKAMIDLTPGDILGGGTSGTGSEALPSYGDAHPDYAGVGGVVPRLDSYAVTTHPNGAATWVARARYSTDGRFKMERKGDLPIDFLAYGGNASSVEVEIPFARREYAEGTDADSRPIGSWELDNLIITSPLSRRTARVQVSASAFGSQPQAMRSFIDREVDRIHKLDFADGSSIHAQFAGWQHSQSEVDLFDIEYEWIIDAGTPLIEFPVSGLIGPIEQSGIPMPRIDYPRAGQGGIPSPGFASYDGMAGFLRPPFHALVMILPADHAQDFGTWFAQPIAFKGDSSAVQAWKSFPGIAP